MLKQMKYLTFIMILGILGIGFAATANAADLVITTRTYDCDSLNGMSYTGSIWPQARTANLLAGQKLSISIFGPYAFADVSINGNLIADDLDIYPAATVNYVVPANDTYDIVIDVIGGDPGNNFSIRCTSGPGSYKTP